MSNDARRPTLLVRSRTAFKSVPGRPEPWRILQPSRLAANLSSPSPTSHFHPRIRNAGPRRQATRCATLVIGSTGSPLSSSNSTKANTFIEMKHRDPDRLLGSRLLTSAKGSWSSICEATNTSYPTRLVAESAANFACSFLHSCAAGKRLTVFGKVWE